MSWVKDQFVPDRSVTDVVVDTVLTPAVESVCQHLGVPRLSVKARVWVNDQPDIEVRQILLDRVRRGPLLNGELRIRFRRTYQTARLLFFAQLKMHEPDRKSGFAGLVVRGDVDLHNQAPVARVSSCTTIYNQPFWFDPAVA